MNEQIEESKTPQFVQVVQALPPYMLAEKWADFVGKSVKAVKKDLQTGVIARYQPAGKGGLVMVNVTKEIQRTENAPDY